MSRPSTKEDHQPAMSLIRTTPLFVGRYSDLDRIAQYLQDVMSGQPRVILLKGEAGIGKTRLVKEIHTMARTRGCQIYAGSGHEDLRLPYLPIVEALRTIWEPEPAPSAGVLAGDLEVMHWLCHPTGAFPQAPDAATYDMSGQDKLRLFLAVSRAIVWSAQQKPAVLTIEDIHWADPSSLEFLSHLTFVVGDTATQTALPLLILLTCRVPDAGTDAGREAQAARFIARLERDTLCTSVELSGLEMSEVQAMIYGLGFGRPTQQFVVMMHSVTQGNPFCIWEMVHRLHQQGTLEKRGGYVSTTVPLPGLRLPTQMTDAIQSRIQILTPRCQEVLKLASCCGTSFSFPLLSQVTTIDDEGLFDLLDEGIQHHLVLDESETFHFAHPLIRHTLYHMSNTVRRQHWHRRIAESLEALYAQESEAHLLEMTHHWVRAGPTADAAKVMAYARRAGDQACRMFAWGEAAQYYESALALGDTKSGLQPQEQAYLHYQAGLAYHRAGDGGPCLSHYEQARAVYAHLDDIVGLARVLLEQTRLGFTLVSVPYGTLVDLQPLEKTLEALGENAPELRGHIAAVMSEAYRHAKQPERATTMATNALTLAEQLDDDRLGAYANFALGLAQAQELYVDATLDSWEKSLACAQRANDVWLQGWSLQRLPLFFLMQGRLDDAEARAQQASELARQAQDWWGYSVASSALAAVAVNKGDFMAVEQYAQETMTMVARCSYPWGGFRALMALACAQTLRGAWEAAEQALNMILEPGRVFPEAGASIRTFVQTIRHWMWSQTRSVAPALEQLATDLAATGDVDNYSLAPFCAFIEMGARHLAPTLVAPVYLSLQKIAERGVQFAVFGVFSLARILGVAASCMQQWEQAEAHFQVAIENATRAHAKPEVGRTYLDYAHMLSVRNQPHDRHQAAVLASQAELLLRTIGIEPLARQAARLVADLQTPQPETYASAVVSVPLLSPLEVDMLLRSTRWHTNFLT